MFEVVELLLAEKKFQPLIDERALKETFLLWRKIDSDIRAQTSLSYFRN
jgi:hypothetical protein